MKLIGTMRGVLIHRDVDGAVVFTAPGLEIDADGCPRAYHPDGRSGLDYLANAGKPGSWWGVAVDCEGRPFVQMEGDAAPGFYVSVTAMEDGRFGRADPRRYVDSDVVPYFVLPSNWHEVTGLKTRLGAKALVTNTRNGRVCEAIYADVGPRSRLGEGSMALARALGIPSSPRTGGCEHGVVFRILG